MDWRLYIAPMFILWLLAMLYVGPSYFRRLGQLIARLESHHAAVFDRLGRPSLSMLKMTIGSSASTVWFVLQRDYRRLEDDEAIRLGDSVWRRLICQLAGFIFIVIAFPIAATYQP